MNKLMQQSTSHLAWLIIGFAVCTSSLAQSEASVDAAVSTLSEGSAEALGTLIGAAAGLSIGAVVISGTLALVTLETAADASETAFSVTLEVPLALARKLQTRRGSRVKVEPTTGGVMLLSHDELIGFLPSADSQNHARRDL